MAKIVHVIGTGTIGEPLTGILCQHAKELGLDEVTFHKRTPLKTDRSKVVNLVDRRGAKLAVDSVPVPPFPVLGYSSVRISYWWCYFYCCVVALVVRGRKLRSGISVVVYRGRERNLRRSLI